MYDIIGACVSGLDLLTVYLLFCGYSQVEISDFLSTSPAVVCRRVKRIYKRFLEGGKE